MLSRLYLFIVAGLARKVVLMAHTEQPRSKAVNYNLKLVGYNPNSVKFLWALDFNNSRFRFREGEFYLTKDSTDRLIKKSGGNALLKYSQDAELNEFKQLIKGSSGIENANNGNKREGSNLIDDERGAGNKGNGQQSEYKDAFVPANKKRSRFSSFLINESTNASFLNGFGDKENSETRESAFSSFEKNTSEKKAKSNNNENFTKRQKSDVESTLKSDLIDQNDVDSTNNLLSENIQSNAYSTTGSTSSVSNNFGPDEGYVFDIIPIFNHKLDKKSLVIKDKMCLTHTLIFKVCDYDSFWDLPEEYYWDIYGAEDQVYLNKIKSFLERKVKNGDKILQNQFAELRGCPNSCPDGNCEQTYDDDEEEGSCPRKSQSKVESEKTKPGQEFSRYNNTNNMPMVYNQPISNNIPAPTMNPMLRLNGPQINQPRSNVMLPTQPVVYPEPNSKNFRPVPITANQNRSDQVLVDRKTLDNLLNYALNRPG